MSVALVALSMVAVTSVNAQPQQREPKSADEIAKMMTERLTKSLELTESQSSKIYDINLKYAEERHAKAEEAKAKREEAKSSKDGEKGESPKCGKECAQQGRPPMPQGQQGRAPQQQQQRPGGKEMGESQKAMMKEIVAVLNTDQIVEFIEMKSKMPARQPQGGRGGMQPQQRGGRQQPQFGSQRGPQGGPQGGRPRPMGPEGSERPEPEAPRE